jgi:hypothetical protein
VPNRNRLKLLKLMTGAACIFLVAGVTPTGPTAQALTLSGQSDVPMTVAQTHPGPDDFGGPPGQFPRPGGPPGFDPPPPPPGHHPHLAALLSEMETQIGIRADQINSWRDFTDALLAKTEPPTPPKNETGTAAAEAQQPFALALKLADATLARAQKAESLKKAVEALREKLTSEQLTKVASIEAHLLPPRHGTPPLPQFAPPPPPGVDGYWQPTPIPHGP